MRFNIKSSNSDEDQFFSEVIEESWINDIIEKQKYMMIEIESRAYETCMYQKLLGENSQKDFENKIE